ncbi:hypothetical protein MMC14_009979 [Varicellaria rhodocarpa]|nr:hypothetical protein [Varicellaria rhodocarpa]
MEEVASEYLAKITDLEKGITFGKTAMISSVTGYLMPTDELCKGEYWVQNLVCPVKFLDALQKVSFRSEAGVRKKLDRTHRINTTIHGLLEIGPSSALQGPIRDTLKTLAGGNDASYNSVLIRNKCAVETLLESAGRLHCQGFPFNLEQLNQPDITQLHSTMILPNLPEYPFDHSKIYWNESRDSTGFRFRQCPHLQLLGTRESNWNPL